MADNVVIVDDNPTNLRLLIEVLTQRGYLIRPFVSGSQALVAIQREKPDIILLDVNMPQMDGYEVCQRLKADATTKDIPVLFLSASNETLDKVKGFEVGGVDYISKPFDALELFARLKTHIALKRSQEKMQQLNSQLEIANGFLQQLNQVKNEFLSMVSHDLQNPLSSILLFSRHIESRQLSEERSKEVASLITKSAQRMFRLIEDLLDLNQLEQGELRIQPERLHLVQLIQEVIEDYQVKAQEKEQRFCCQFPPELRPIAADPLRVRQVLENLISNALKFSPSDTTVHIRLEQEHHQVILAIQDEGPGLSSSEQQFLFQKFIKLSALPTGGEHSTGLGLAIVKKLVEAMAGNVWCHSTVGQGCCFYVALPSCTAAE